MTTEIEEFAKILVEWVRDAAIRSCDLTFRSNGVTGKRWKETAVSSGSPEAFAKVIIPDIVDDTIAHFLAQSTRRCYAFSFTAANGKSVDLATETDGLSGLYGGEWCKKYTKERFIDNFADLDHFFDKPLDSDQS